MNKDKISISESISRLIELTRNGTIKWLRPTSWPDDIYEIANVFETIYNDRKLRIIEYKRPDIANRIAVLKIISKDGQLEWEFPDHFKLIDLVDTIKYQKTDVEEFLKSLF
ncbi:MAG TPA: hypothetical protein VIN67_03235 [Desulfobaccales bacterium]